MGHCGELGNELWATAADLLYERYGATVRNEAVQYKSVTIPMQWAIAQDFVVPYGS
jgi:hypothetical protein